MAYKTRFWLTYNNQAKADCILDKIAFKDPDEAEALGIWFMEKLAYDKKVSVSDICDVAMVNISDEDRKVFDHIGFTDVYEILSQGFSVGQNSIYQDMYTVNFPLEFVELI